MSVYWGDTVTNPEWVLSQMTQLNPGALWMFSPDFTELLFVTDGYEEIWGRSVEALQADPTTFLDGIHPDDRAEVQAEMEALANEQPSELEYRVIPPDSDAQQRHVWVKGRPVYQDGEFVAIAGFVRDITARKRAKQTLQYRNDQLEQLNRFLSHDLRNHLQIGQGSLQAAREDSDNEYLEQAANALDRIADLTEDVSTLIRPDTLEPTRVSVAALADDSWEGVRTGESELVVDTEQSLRADEGLLQRFLENLFQNAIAHNGPPVTVWVGSPADEPGFYVADDGAGISADAKTEIFETGYSTGASGSGLGLAIVQMVATAHGWDIDVTESKTGGARFEVTNVETLPD
jgi:PAS domain S-box-containing protein